MSADTPLAVLVARMRDAGLAPDPEELADALWLARWVPGAGPGARLAESDGSTRDEAAVSTERSGAEAEATAALRRTPPASRTPRPRREAGGTVQLAVPGGTGAAAAGLGRVRAPSAPAFSESVAIQRALRPLYGYRAPTRPVRAELDEAATAERTADTGLFVPVLRRTRRREARLLLVMDASSSMLIWEEAFRELRALAISSGAFREVRLHFLHEGNRGRPGLAGSLRGGPLRRPEQLSDPTGHQVTLVFSDCVGPMWRNGSMHGLLHRWARSSPLAVIQPLPQHMWRRTHLPAQLGELRRREGPAGRLEFRPLDDEEQPGGLPVPLLAPRYTSLGDWTRLVCGGTEQSLWAAAGWVHADHPAARSTRSTDRPVPVRDRVRVFLRRSSQDAARLVGYLAAAPLVLPVMRLVQRAMLPGSGPDVLAEVLVGGLLRRIPDVGGFASYEFVDGVRTELLRRGAEADLHLVLKHCSEYVERWYGRSAHNFPAIAAAYLEGRVSGGPGDPAFELPEDDGLRAFARVSAEVMRRFGWAGGPDRRTSEIDPEQVREVVRRVRDLNAAYKSSGDAATLDTAVDLLRQVIAETDSPADGLRAILAGMLLLRWRDLDRPSDLREAFVCALEEPSQSGRAASHLARSAREITEGEMARCGSEEERRVLWRSLLGGEEPPGEPITGNSAVGRMMSLVAARLRRALPASEGDMRAELAGDLVNALDAYAEAEFRFRSGQDAITPDDNLRRWQRDAQQAVDVARDYLESASTPAEAYVVGLGGMMLLEQAGRAQELSGQDPDAGRYWAEEAITFLTQAIALTPSADERLTLLYSSLAGAQERAATAEGRLDSLLAANGNLVRALETTPESDDRSITDCLVHLSFNHWNLYGSTRDDEHYDLAVQFLTEALRLTPEDPSLLTLLAQMLLEGEAGSPRTAADADQAVRSLRRALDLTAADDPEQVRRHLLFGGALQIRYAYEHALADLHEARWALGVAARGDDKNRTHASGALGTVLVQMADVTGSHHYRLDAADHFQQAAELAVDLGFYALAARARADRAEVLEATAGPVEALAEYRRAHALLARADEAGRANRAADQELAERIADALRRAERP